VTKAIPSLITDRINTMLTRLPTHEEIKNAVFSLNKDSSPGPDGFGAIFFQTFWNIIKLDVINAVMQFFTSGWIMPNFNANTLVLIPKTDHADNVSDYRPIAIANFKFKLISKIIAVIDYLQLCQLSSPLNNEVSSKGGASKIAYV
jgi:hypothetical protein